MTLFSNGFVTLEMPKDFEPIATKDEFNDMYLVNTKIPMSIKFSTTPTLVGLPEIREDIEKNLTGDAKAYARALKAMPVIYEENGKSDTDQELVSVLNRIRSSGNTSNSSSSNANNGSSNGSSSNNSNSMP